MVQIEELTLRVPGYSAEESRGLGNEVARRVADGLPAQQKGRHLGALDLQVSIPPGTSRNQVAKLIAKRILRGLV